MRPTLSESIAAGKARPRGGHRPDFDECQGAYRVRFVRDRSELAKVFRLRYEVFNLELGEGLEESRATGLDTDPFDAQCEHIVVEHRRTGEVIGTYRVQVLEQAEAGAGLYMATEYDVSVFPAAVMADMVECGRACIARAHRNKIVLYLLFRGLAAYALWNARRYFIGCSSLTTQDPEQGLRALDHLVRTGYMHPIHRARALPAYECVVDGHVDTGAAYPIPTLFGTYLRYGAQVWSDPAIDRYFGTIDFLTVVDLAAVGPRVVSLFFAGQEGGPA